MNIEDVKNIFFKPNQDLQGHLVVRSSRPGPKVLCVGATHGNEPAGILACAQWFKLLLRQIPLIKGEVHFLLANPRAFEKNERYIDYDLNRSFQKNCNPSYYESKRAQEIIELFKDQSFDVVLDLHTVSVGEEQIVVFNASRAKELELAKTISPIPVFLGYHHEHIEGLLGNAAGDYGAVSLIIECGNHLSTTGEFVAAFHIHELLLSLDMIKECPEQKALSQFIIKNKAPYYFQTLDVIKPTPGFHYLLEEVKTGVKILKDVPYARSDVMDYTYPQDAYLMMPSLKIGTNDYNVGMICSKGKLPIF